MIVILFISYSVVFNILLHNPTHCNNKPVEKIQSFPGRLVVKNLPANAGDVGWIPGSGRSLGEGNGNPLQCSCLGNPVDRGAWQATILGGHKESDMT